MSDEEKRARGGRLRALRKALGLSQEAVASRSGDAFPREKMSIYENGGNAMSSDAVQRGLARGLGIRRDDVGPYLDGTLSLDEVRRRAPQSVVVVPLRRSESLERVIERNPGKYAEGAIAAARALYAADGEDMSESAWETFMLDVMRRKRIATRATIDDDRDPGEALDSAAKKKPPRR